MTEPQAPDFVCAKALAATFGDTAGGHDLTYASQHYNVPEVAEVGESAELTIALLIDDDSKLIIPRGQLGNSMVAKPDVSISAEEPKSDRMGQFWGPAKVSLVWPDGDGMPGPSVEVSVIVAIRGQMTVDELRTAQVQAAHDVLNAALLSLERTPKETLLKRQSIR